MPGRGIQHVDLCVADVERSLRFYLELLGPVGLEEHIRVESYRGTEEVVYLRFGTENLGLRPADGGEHSYYGVGIEHLAFEVDTREEVDAAFERAVSLGVRVHFPPEEDDDLDDYYSFFVFDPDGIRFEVFCAKQGRGQRAPLVDEEWSPGLGHRPTAPEARCYRRRTAAAVLLSRPPFRGAGDGEPERRFPGDSPSSEGKDAWPPPPAMPTKGIEPRPIATARRPAPRI